MRFSKWFLLLTVALSATNCSRRVERIIDGDNQSGVIDELCDQANAVIRPLSFTGSEIQQGMEVLWQVEAAGCTGFKLIRTDDSSVRSFTFRAHFTKRYNTAGTGIRETVLVQPVASDGTLGAEITVQSAAFNVVSNGSGDDDDDGDDENAPLVCQAHADFSTLTARKDSADNWVPNAPWMAFTVAANSPSRLLPSGDTTDTTLFPSGIPSASALSVHRVAGQLQKEGLNIVTFRVAKQSDPTQQATCIATVLVNVIKPPPPPPLACRAYGVPGYLGTPVNGSGQPIGPVFTGFRVESNRLTRLSGARNASGPQPLGETWTPTFSHAAQVAVPGLGWNTVEFEVTDAADATKKAACSTNVWVYGIVAEPAPTCTISAPDSSAPNAAVSVRLVATGGLYYGEIEGFGHVLPGSGIATDFPTATKTYVGRVVGPTGTGICTKTVSVIPAPTCQLVASANPIHPAQSVKLSIIGTGAFSSAEITLPTETRVVPVGDPSTMVNPEITTTYTARLTGPGGVGSCSTTVQVDPVKIGVHLEDSRDWDLNDATVCMTGMFKIDGYKIVSTKDQGPVNVRIYKNSSCLHWIELRVIDKWGSVDHSQSRKFLSILPPADLRFYFDQGSRLDVKYQALGACWQVGTVGLSDHPRVQIDKFCRTSGN